jgi:hypothetical protein
MATVALSLIAHPRPPDSAALRRSRAAADDVVLLADELRFAATVLGTQTDQGMGLPRLSSRRRRPLDRVDVIAATGQIWGYHLLRHANLNGDDLVDFPL